LTKRTPVGYVYDEDNNIFLDATKRAHAKAIREKHGKEGEWLGINSVTDTNFGKDPVLRDQVGLRQIERELNDIEDIQKDRPILGGYEDSIEASYPVIGDEKTILKILSKRYRNVSITEINTENDLKKLALRKPDLVFSGVKYFYFAGGIVWLNDYLELHDISYIASNRTALHNEHDKSIAKKIIQKANIRTADFFTTEPGEHQNEMSIPISFPLFIKPLTGGDSRGIDANSIVYDFLSFQAKILDIKRKHNLRSLVETYLSGKEYSGSILQEHSNGNLKAMPIEIVAKKNINGHRILDYDIKENDHEKVIEVSDSKIFNQLSDLSKNAFTALDGKSLGRIDIKMDHRGVPHFIEANLMPGLRKGYFNRSCLLILNISYEIE